MSDDTETTGGPEREGDAFADLLAEGIRRYSEEGAEAVEELSRLHPQDADRLRARLDSLARLGLLGGAGEDGAPRRFGRYEVIERLGQGGMGVVWLVRDPDDGRRLALKAGLAPLAKGDRLRERFEREIRAFSQLEHPNIVPVHDVGEANGRPYFTMELIEGATLGEAIEALRGRGARPGDLTAASIQDEVERAAERIGGSGGRSAAWGRSHVEVACRLVLGVADALAHAHRAGIVHRDVKPSNVLVRRDGTALLFDLGLAHLEAEATLTRTGDFAGTPHYVSPEQAAGAHDVDGRSDVYSLGVTLFELLTLRRPFEGAGAAQVLQRIQSTEAPSPRRLSPLVPRDLETICLTAMEKAPDHRYGSMDELRDDLRRFLDFRPVRARPIGPLRRVARWARRRPAVATAAGLALAIVIGLPIGLAWANETIRTQRDRAEANATEAQRQARRNARQIDFLVELFRLAGTEPRAGEAGSARSVLERAVLRIETEYADAPLARASLMEATGRVYHGLGLHERALHQLDRSFAILFRELGEGHADVVAVLHALAMVHLEAGRTPAARDLARRALAVDVDSRFEAGVHVTLGEACARLGDHEEARESWARALELRAADPAADRGLRADVLERLGSLARERGRLDEAAARWTEALELRRAELSPDPRSRMRTLELLAEVEDLRGRSDGARALAEEARTMRAGWSSAAELATAPLTPREAELAIAELHLVPPWKDAFDRSFQAGVTAFQSGRDASAVAAFEACLELDPSHPAAAYNLACGHAILGRRDLALDWLERSIDFGYGYTADRWETLARDDDLAPLRDDPRFDALIAGLSVRRKALEADLREPLRHAHAGPSGAGPFGLLVVLHAEGERPEEVVRGPWAQVADELGMALLAPFGSVPAPGSGGESTAWIDDVGGFVRRPWVFEGHVADAVRIFCDEHPVDRERVYVVGEGLGGLVAFDLALRAPGLFRGALLVDGAILPQVDPEHVRRAAALGTRLRAALREPSALPGSPAGLELEEHGRALERWFARRGLGEARVSRLRSGVEGLRREIESLDGLDRAD